MLNGFVELFNRRLRDELLNETLSRLLTQARRLIEAWRTNYYHERPHEREPKSSHTERVCNML